MKLQDAYLSVHEALKHSGIHHGTNVRVRWVDAEGMSPEEAAAELERSHGVLVPGGFGSRGWEGKITGLPRGPRARHPVPRDLPRDARRDLRVRAPRGRARRRQLDRDGSRDAVPGHRPPARSRRRSRTSAARCGSARSRSTWPRARAAQAAYGETVVYERHRHRYEVNNHYRQALVDAGLVVSGTYQEGRLVEIIELPDHPWFVASQFHPEFKSRPTRPAPLFREFVGAALERARQHDPVRVAAAD